MGLYGNILVVPKDPDYWPPAHREVLLTLDDILIEDGRVAAFSRTETTHAAMGRFGNTMLIAGEPISRSTRSRRGGPVLPHEHRQHPRLQRRLPGARMKLVGGDSGRYEHEEFVDSVMLAPSERAGLTSCSTTRERCRSSTGTRSAPTSSQRSR